jgi:hypothetical protein
MNEEKNNNAYYDLPDIPKKRNDITVYNAKWILWILFFAFMVLALIDFVNF